MEYLWKFIEDEGYIFKSCYYMILKYSIYYLDYYSK